MRRNEKITTIMTPSPDVVQVGQALSDVDALMRTGGYHHVPVVDGDHLVGILSSTDLLRVSYAFRADPREINAVMDSTVTIGDLMTAEPTRLHTAQTVRDAVEVLAEGRFHSLPVVDIEGKLVGLVTTTDVLRYMLEQY